MRNDFYDSSLMLLGFYSHFVIRYKKVRVGKKGFKKVRVVMEKVKDSSDADVV